MGLKKKLETEKGKKVLDRNAQLKGHTRNTVIISTAVIIIITNSGKWNVGWGANHWGVINLQ